MTDQPTAAPGAMSLAQVGALAGAIRAEVERRLALYAALGVAALIGVVVALKVLG